MNPVTIVTIPERIKAPGESYTRNDCNDSHVDLVP